MALPQPLIPPHRCAVIVICCLLGACAARQPPSSPEARQEQTAAETSQQMLTVKSSHGVQKIPPTVVGYNAKPAKGEESADDQQADFDDPLEFINRPIFTFNDVLYRHVLIPVSQGYKKVVPQPVQTGVSHFFANIREPINGINNLLQGKGAALANNLSRFVINSTIGILGLFDPAQSWLGIDAQVAHIDDTLRSYDVGYGSYLVLPFLGPSDLRNGFSTIAESIASPIRQLTDDPQTLYLQSYEGFHDTVPTLLSYDELRKNKDDPYVFFRNLYMQSVLRDQQFPIQEDKPQAPRGKDSEEPAPQPQDDSEQP